MSMNPLNVLHAIQTYPSREITLEAIKKSRNHVQVTFGNRTAIYNLEEEEPTSSPEQNATHKLLNPQRYTENGIRVVCNEEFETLKSKQAYGLSIWIQSRSQGEYYFHM